MMSKYSLNMCLTVVSQNNLPNSRLPDYLQLANGKWRDIRCTSRYLSTHSTCSSTSTQRSVKTHRGGMDAAKSAVICLRLQSADCRRPTVTARRKHQHYSHYDAPSSQTRLRWKSWPHPGAEKRCSGAVECPVQLSSPQQEMKEARLWLADAPWGHRVALSHWWTTVASHSWRWQVRDAHVSIIHLDTN